MYKPQRNAAGEQRFSPQIRDCRTGSSTDDTVMLELVLQLDDTLWWGRILSLWSSWLPLKTPSMSLEV